MKSKVLLMGKSGSGKTSMRTIIFANYVARDTSKLTPTLFFENTDIKFLGNLVLNLWDCGGQDSFMEKYFESQRDQIFRNVAVLIYVFDVESSEINKDVAYFKRCLQAIQENSKDATIFCLIHKMDVIPPDQRLEVFSERAQELTALGDTNFPITCFGTSIWDETLYKAWSAIVYSLVPNVEKLQAPLRKLCRICQAEEVILFERATFLVISSAEQTYNNNTNDHISPLTLDAHRHEKLSNVVKQFKLACLRSHSQFQSLVIRNQFFTAHLDILTPTTYILVISHDPRVLSGATRLSIAAARPLFAKYIPSK